MGSKLPRGSKGSNAAQGLKQKASQYLYGEATAVPIPPQAIEAERALLGGLLLENSYWDASLSQVGEKDFYLPEHQLLFKHMQRLYDARRPLDLITLSQSLESEEALEAVGGFAYLVEISKNTPSVSNTLEYARIVRENATLRSLISTAREIAELGFSPQGRSSEILLDLAESKIFQIAERGAAKNVGPKPIQSVLNATVEHLEKLAADPSHNGITGLASGFTGLDKKTAGFQPADLVVLAARPSMGKTTLAMNICEHAAIIQDRTVLIFSLEMPAEQLMIRMLASLSRVDQTRLRTGQLKEEDWARVASSIGLLQAKKNIFIDDASWLTPAELRMRARRVYQESNGLALIVVDYLQLMHTNSQIENRTLEVAEISRALKSLAKELSVPIIALSQLNRGLEQRADKRPINSDLRDSGSIEQDADLVLFVYRDEVYHETSNDKGIAEVIVGKHRNGPTGTVKLVFQGHLARFDNLASPGLAEVMPSRLVNELSTL